MIFISKRKSGNLLIGCYAAYDKEGRGVGMLITPEKKLSGHTTNLRTVTKLIKT